MEHGRHPEIPNALRSWNSQCHMDLEKPEAHELRGGQEGQEGCGRKSEDDARNKFPET